MEKRIYSERHKKVAYILVGLLCSILFLALLALFLDGEGFILSILCCIGLLLALIMFPRGCVFYIISVALYGTAISMKITNFLNNVDIIEGFSAVIGTLGMVSFALTYINAARVRKLKGILLEDVINAFYPHYKWILVLNGCLACLGRFGCAACNGIVGSLCLLGMII